MMKHKIGFFFAAASIALLPFVARAAFETGTVTEDFGSTGRREERATYALWDTRNKEISLPLRYSVRVLPAPATFPAVPANNSQFAPVADRFSRVPSGKIRANAMVASDGTNTYAAGPVLYASMGGGIELTGVRVPELQDAEIKQLQSGQGAVTIGGRKGGKNFLVEFSLQGFVNSSAVQFTKMADAGSGRFFKKITLTTEGEVPDATQVEYMVSGDGGSHFEDITTGVEKEFSHIGNDLRMRITLITQNVTQTPYLRKVHLEFSKADVETPASARNRDNKRISDLNDLASKLERFKKDRGVYPIVDDRYPNVRFNQLGQLLIEGKYSTKMPEDPKHAEDMDRVYDYISSKSGDAYVLRARFEEQGSKALSPQGGSFFGGQKDVDGKPVESALYDYTCDDPTYCIGKGLTAPVSVTVPAPAPVGVAEVVQDEQGRVYRIATIGGGATQIEKRKLYIPSFTLLNSLREFYGRMQKVGQQTITDIPRVRLMKTADKDDIFYITATLLKRRIPSEAVFQSYGNDRREVVVVKPEELAAYPDSRLIRLTGDTRVWYLEGGSRRLVRSSDIMRRHGFLFKNVAPVNFAEYNSYPEGMPLE